jgi:DNA topoisomerase IB
MCFPSITNRLITIAILFFALSISLICQSNNKSNDLDKAIENGLNAVKGKKWEVALNEFSNARKLQDKEKLPSNYLYNALVLPDEDRSASFLSDTEKNITGWRHAIGATQAVRVFQAYAAALAGKRTEATHFPKRSMEHKVHFGAFLGGYSM